MPQFTVENLKRDQLPEAWAVARMCGWHPSAEWWIHDASLLIEQGGGVLAARSPDRCIYGIATYRPIDSRSRGRVLAVESLETFELSRKAPARRALCDALDDLSLALECDELAFAMLPDGSLHN